MHGCCQETMNSSLVGAHLPQGEFDIFHKEEKKKVHLSDYRGKWLILFFYPADFTFVCPTELEDMAKHYAEFQKAGAEIVSVSTDTVYVHKAWHDTSEAVKKIEFPMLADPTAKLCKALGTYLHDKGESLRATFIIDPDGVIQAYEINANNLGRSAADTLRKLQAAAYVREHGDEACPANWKPGAKTLRPGLDLVGKI